MPFSIHPWNAAKNLLSKIRIIKEKRVKAGIPGEERGEKELLAQREKAVSGFRLRSG
jgi:hypothetical protein